MQNLFQVATELQDAITTHVTSSTKMKDEDYRRKRDLIVQEASIRKLIPEFVIKYRSIDQIEKYFIARFTTYAERRQSIWDAFTRLLNFLEFNNADISTPTTSNKVFISYSVLDKEVAGSIKSMLSYVGLESFLAHEDIDVSQEWANRILEEINSSSIFICLLSKNFLSSDFCLQETGIAASKNDICIIPLSLDGAIPPGFLRKIQSSKIDSQRPKIEDLLPAFIKHDRNLANQILVSAIKSAPNYRFAENYCLIIMTNLAELSEADALSLIEACRENSQIYDAVRCAQIFFPVLRNTFKHLITEKDDLFFKKQIIKYGGQVN